MKTISLPLSVSMSIVMFIIGVGTGYFFTPQYSLSMFDKTTMDLGRPDRYLDLRYINAMISHHRGAMLLAQQVTTNSRPEVVSLAQEILKNEPVAISELYQWKKTWYADDRQVPDPVVSHLGVHDTTFDLRFLNALIAHHQNGIIMTKDIKLKSSRSEILNNADAVENFLNNGIDMLKGWRKEWHAI